MGVLAKRVELVIVSGRKIKWCDSFFTSPDTVPTSQGYAFEETLTSRHGDLCSSTYYFNHSCRLFCNIHEEKKVKGNTKLLASYMTINDITMLV